jgi:FixJ family two-component response regulator
MVGALLDKPWGPASMTDQKLVYILDDDPDIRTALERLLSMHGYRSCLFASVAEFYAGAKPQQAVCLIVDIQLNGAGFELKRRLSQFDPGLPVIFITGSDTEENRLAAHQEAAAAYLPKPFGSKALISAIETADRSASPPSPTGSRRCP